MNSLNSNQNSIQQNNSTSPAPQTACVETYYAQPYSLDAQGFYFSDLEDYEAKAEALKDCYGNQVEEFEIQFIDGSKELCDLFNACYVNQANLGQFLAIVDEVPEHQYPSFYFLMEQGRDMEDALNNYDEVQVQSGNLEDAAQELFDEIYMHEVPKHLQQYIDYSAFANDCQCGGDLVEFEFGGDTYTCTNANSL